MKNKDLIEKSMNRIDKLLLLQNKNLLNLKHYMKKGFWVLALNCRNRNNMLYEELKKEDNILKNLL